MGTRESQSLGKLATEEETSLRLSESERREGWEIRIIHGVACKVQTPERRLQALLRPRDADRESVPR